MIHDRTVSSTIVSTRQFLRSTLRSASIAIAVYGLIACGGGDGSNPVSDSTSTSSGAVKAVQVAQAVEIPPQVFNFSYKAAPADNPLKGFVPYAGSHTFPYSMEWFYMPLKAIQTDYETFDWSALEKNLNDIKARGNQAVFRIYLDYPQSDYGVPAFLAHVPKYSYTDHGNKTSFSPDYTHPDLRRAVLNFIKAFGERYDKDPRIGFVTAGLLGFWGEWHTYAPDSNVGNIPEDFFPAVADAYDAAFPTKMILARGPVGKVSNKYSRLGFHDDSFALSTIGTTNWHFWPKMVAAGLQDSWKTRPMGGEVFPGIQGCIWDNSCTNPKNQSFSDSVATTHATWLINHGAFVGGYSGAKLQRTIEQSQSMGYALHIPKATLESASTAQALRGTVSIENRGVAPFYYPWTVQLAAVDDAGRLTTWSMNWDLRTVLPGSPGTWNFNVPGHGLAAGNFMLLMGVPNPMEGGRALKFANTTQDQTRQNWLSLGAFTVKSGGGGEMGGGSEVTSLVLVNASNGAQIRTLSPNATNTISINSLQGQSFSIRALPDPGPDSGPKSVKFETDSGISRTEGAAPWALLGNRGSVYTAWSPTIGKTYTVSATGFSAQGVGSRPMTVSIKIEP